MPVFVKIVNLLRVWASLGCLLALFLPALPANAQQRYVVAPLNQPSQMRLLPSEAWPPPASGAGEMFVKLSYLRGVMDALQYAQVAPRQCGKVLELLAGRDLTSLAARIDTYYAKDPRRRELPPATVLIRILPHLNDKASKKAK